MTQVSTTSATASLNGVAGAATSGTSSVDPTLKKVAEQFEAIFLRQMIGAMRSSSLSEGMFDSSATQQFQDMADAQTADNMSHNGGMGIADMLIKQFGQTKPQTAATTSASKASAAMSIVAQQGNAS